MRTGWPMGLSTRERICTGTLVCPAVAPGQAPPTTGEPAGRSHVGQDIFAAMPKSAT